MGSYCLGGKLLTTIDEILSVAKGLLAIRESFAKAKKERRENVAVYFEKISTCLAETAKELRKGVVPHGMCGRMSVYAEEFEETVKGLISKEKAEKFSQKLKDNYATEHAVDDIIKARERESEIDKIEEASGVFQGLADSIRAR
jgi:hypothetical protein